MTGMKNKRAIVLLDRDSGHSFRFVASFSASILGGENVRLKGAEQSNGLKFLERFIAIVESDSEPLLHFQKHIGQVRINLSPGSHERIARCRIDFAPQTRPLLGRRVVSAIFA